MKPACGPDFLGPLLGHATHLARERMDARLSRYDMTPSQTHTLLYLSSHGYTAPQRDVVEHLRVRPSTANGILDRMEEKGLIRRTADENDQRQKQVTATEKGRELNSLVQAAFQEAEAVMVKGLRHLPPLPDKVSVRSCGGQNMNTFRILPFLTSRSSLPRPL